MAVKTITIYHSPDADDAFMFYGLDCGAVQVPGYAFEHKLMDIQTLNDRALRGELDVTAVSVHAYARLGGQYVILDSGASMGGPDYGPRLVGPAGSTKTLPELKRLAIPGALTSATLALELYLREKGLTPELVNIRFDEVQNAVRRGEVDAGVIIHEGQLTYGRQSLALLLDLGAWWWEKTGLPLPLGVNIARASLGAEAIEAVSTALHESIEYGLANREKALDYAMTYGRGISKAEADKFVGMYVNERTRSLGEVGRKAIELFLSDGQKAGLIPMGETPKFLVNTGS